MAKFNDYMKNSKLTWSDLSDSTNKKVDAFETLYKTYSNAYDAGDKELADKYDKELDVLDDEILAMIKKEEAEVKNAVEGLKEKEAKEEVKKEVVEDVKSEKTTPTESKSEEPKSEEPKSEKPKEEEPKKSWWDDVNVGMFE